ncbi:hypothetical protein DB31_1299 [Hyalangium minutum]|uniref:Uncharacterized protein n=1 Tax=Hyalangium minutum TaxID=394096 RepID=A0A085WEX1_9BACT|nr:hypothetical protein DB31_1299 [Hyalangium minutum]
MPTQNSPESHDTACPQWSMRAPPSSRAVRGEANAAPAIPRILRGKETRAHWPEMGRAERRGCPEFRRFP